MCVCVDWFGEGVLLTPVLVCKGKRKFPVLWIQTPTQHSKLTHRTEQCLPHHGPLKHPVCAPARVIGTPFYLMEYCPGLIYKDPSLPGLEPSQRRAIYTAMNRVLCKIHSVDLKAVGLEDYGKHGEHGAACLLCCCFLTGASAFMISMVRRF